MPDLTTRAGKGSSLTHNELDANFKRTVSQKTANYTCLVTDNRSVIEVNSATAKTITLSDAATMQAADTGDYEVTITNIGAGNVTITCDTVTDTINGSTSDYTLIQYGAVTLQVNSAGDGYMALNNTRTDVVVSGHVKAGNLQIWGGDTTTAFAVSTNITAGTFESVGATGSGADNIWTALDSVPGNARIILVDLVLNSTTAADDVRFFMRDPAQSYAANNTNNQVLKITGVGGGTTSLIARAMVPYDGTKMSITWNRDNDGTVSLMYYRGFITD